MIELNELGPVVDVAVGITILMGTGAAVTWWMTRRVENRIKDEVKLMDRLQSIENRVTSVEAKMDNMATKQDLAEMATKQDLTEMETKMDGMATKQDLAEMATKQDLTEMEAKMDNMAAGVSTMKTELLEAIKNVNGNGHR